MIYLPLRKWSFLNLIINIFMAMKKLYLTTVIVCIFSLNINAQSQGLTDPIFDMALYDGSMLTWQIMPLKTDRERAGVRELVTTVKQTCKGEFEGISYGDGLPCTADFDGDGNLIEMIQEKMSSMTPGKYLPNTKTNYTYENGLLKKYEMWEETEGSYGVEPHRHVHTLYYNDNRKPVKEIYQAFAFENGEWRKFSSDDNETNWTFDYNPDGSIKSGKVTSEGTAIYNPQGLLMKRTDLSTPDWTYTWDNRGRCTGKNEFSPDELEDDIYHEIERNISYNDKGHIIRFVKKSYLCTSDWKRIKVEYSNTYTVKYEYDNFDNWTKAVVYQEKGKNRKVVLTVTRQHIYG